MLDYGTGHPPRLNPLQHIRLRPGMYIGGVNQRALSALILEMVAEAIECGCTEMNIILQPGETVRFRAAGDWLKVAPLENMQLSEIEYALTPVPRFKMHREYKIAHAGLSVVNALAETIQVEARQAGFLWRQDFIAGERTSDLNKLRPLSDGEAESICFTFKPDFTILEPNKFDFTAVARRLQELAFLMSHLTLWLRDERDGLAVREVTFHKPDGLLGLIQHINRDMVGLHDPIYARKTVIVQKEGAEDRTLTVEFAVQYMESEAAFELSFANGTETTQGGTHIEALKRAVSNIISGQARKTGVLLEHPLDLLAGFTGIIQIEYAKIGYLGATWRELASPEIENAIYNVVRDALDAFAERHPDQVQRIIDHCLRHQQANEARRYGEFAASSQV
jgi:DNA gyrase subunit B